MIQMNLYVRDVEFDPWVRKICWRRKLATHSSILVWSVLWTEEPGGLQFIGSQRVGHNCNHLGAAVYHISFLRSSIDEHLGCLAIVNSAVMNIGVHVCS